MNKTIKTWNDGCWSKDLYYLDPQPEHPPAVIVDDVEKKIYRPMCTQEGLKLYYKTDL